eukprot:TRINITY_DN71294_c1_g1_i1.p1 TRINITY_DN71294_c1_g1~~TRINITY_DN71294_c1_g1_i1.p1  ORF type:complete len:596 (-),score=87.21 TRINITY_DN71294_c1_g1_i1:3189-4976(-)
MAMSMISRPQVQFCMIGKNKQGHVTKAEQQYWITKRPAVLSIQIQRLAFDKATKKPKKINSPVHFDKTIYLDRFMLENKQLVGLGKSSICKYKEKIAKLKDGLHRYTCFGEEKMDLRKSLSTAIEFIKSQANDEITLVDVYEGTDVVYDPRGIGVTGNAECAVRVLEQSLGQVSQQVELMEKTLAEYEDRVAKYEGMKKHPYDLHAILIHSGGAESGHYYAFIFDAGKKKWRRYNDEEVTEETEENVFKEAIGDGKSPASAYFLIYVARSEMSELGGRDFALSASKLVHTGCKEIINYYSSLLPTELKREVFEDNLRLDFDIMEKKADWICTKALDIYQKRHAKLMQAKKLRGYPEWNFVANLEENRSPYYRYILLDSIIIEVSEGSISLDMLDEHDPIYKVLNDKFMKSCSYPPPSLSLTEGEKTQIELKEKEFQKFILDKRMQQHILTKLLAKGWSAALDAIEVYLSNGIYSDTSNKKIVEDILRLVSLRLMSLVNYSLMCKNTKHAVTALKYISQQVIKYLGTDDPHIAHPRRYLGFVFKECAAILSSEETAIVNKELEVLANYKMQENKPVAPDPVSFSCQLMYVNRIQPR